MPGFLSLVFLNQHVRNDTLKIIRIAVKSLHMLINIYVAVQQSDPQLRKKWEAVIPATSEIGLLNLIKRSTEKEINMMFTKLKNAFLGRNRMSKKEKEQLSYFLQYEYKFNKRDADSLVNSGEYRKIMETYNA